MVYRTHGVAEVGADRRAGVHGGERLLVRRVGVPDGRHDAAVDEQADGVERAGQLGREGHHAHTAEVEQVL